MIYEAKVSFTQQDNKGYDKVFKQAFVINDAETFTEVEAKMYKDFDGYKDFDVTDIKRSVVKEIANSRTYEDEKIYEATLLDVYLEEDGTEKETTYRILFFSKSYESANAYITEYVKQGYNLEIIKLRKTKFVDVIEVNS